LSVVRASEGRPHAPRAGLCAFCAYQRLVPNTRGSVFSLCERARSEPDRFRRYPPLPVLVCAGHEPRTASDATR
jgi:hypothetical protein